MSNIISDYSNETQIRKLGKKIIKTYKSYGIHFNIDKVSVINDRIIFRVMLALGNKVSDIRKHEKNVQMFLKLPLFQVLQEDLSVFIVTSMHTVSNNNLMWVLTHNMFEDAVKGMRVPFVVGLDLLGSPLIIDLSKMPNLILGGTSNSGKTVSLKSLILSVAWSCSPDTTHILILDNGAADLMAFKDLPHLLNPIIDDAETGLKSIIALNELMNSRIAIKRKDLGAFNKLPYIVVVIDEFPALVSSFNDKQQKLLTDTMLNLLQRCRHANTSIVLTAQNPTKENLKLDLGSIAARMAFRCAKGTS